MGITPPRWLTSRSADRWSKRIAIILVVVAGITFTAWVYGAAQTTPPSVSGNCNNFGNNNFNCNTFNFGPVPLRFTEKFAEDAIARMPAKKKVLISVIGPSQETMSFGAQMATFFKNKGYDAEWTYTGMAIPTPPSGITFREDAESYIWTVVH